MKITYVNNVDLAGQRFNGYQLQKYLNSIGATAKMLVYEKSSGDSNVISFADSINTLKIYNSCEKKFSFNNLLFPYGKKIESMSEFQQADIIHYQLIHNNLISISDFPHMTHLNRSVWTMHDPWCFTGHCVHPLDCQKWKTGCVACPHLDRHFPMTEDRAAQFWQLKKRAWAEVDADIVISTKWMEEYLKASPLTSHFKRVHIIPFGIDLELFKPDPEKRAQVRHSLKISDDEFVIMFRSNNGLFKNLPFIEGMLGKYKKRLTIFTVEDKWLLYKQIFRHKIKDFGWVDEEKLAELYAACDLFLMPSLAESFGVMAIEAMASGVPVIVLKDTVLESITFADEAGIAINSGDIQQFVSVVSRLANSPDERRNRGELARKKAEQYYDEKLYLSRILALYEEILKRPYKKE